METQNKNKEEIEKMKKGCNISLKTNLGKCGQKFNNKEGIWLCDACESALEERIKTSILWCEDEIEFLNDIYGQSVLALLTDEEYVPKRINEKTKQLQTHLTYLKEQEKKQ